MGIWKIFNGSFVLDDDFVINACLRVAEILSAIGTPDGMATAVAYPRYDGVDIEGFPMEANTNLPFWFVVPTAVNNEKMQSHAAYDYGTIILSLQLYLDTIGVTWGSEAAVGGMQMLGRVMSVWTTSINNRLGFDNGSFAFPDLFGIKEVSGITWPSGIRGLSASPNEYAAEEYVGLVGELTLGFDNRLEEEL